MGLFDRLLGKGPDRTQWGGIVDNITVGLEEVRRNWFQACIEVLEDGGSGESGITIKKRTLGGDGLHAVKAYQLFLTFNYMAQHQYVPRRDGRDFADLLFAQVCGSEYDEVAPYFERYESTPGGKGLFRFTSDVAEYVTGDEAPLMEAMSLAATSPMFAQLTHMVLAASFGDHATVQSLQRTIEDGKEE